MTSAGDAQQALQQILVDRFDLVLMDLRLPGDDGLEASRRLLMQLGAQAPPAESSGSVEPQPKQPVQFDIDRDRLRPALRLLERLLSHHLLSARHQLLAIEPLLGEGAAKTAFEPVAQATRALRFKTARVALDRFSAQLGLEPGQA